MEEKVSTLVACSPLMFSESRVKTGKEYIVSIDSRAALKATFVK